MFYPHTRRDWWCSFGKLLVVLVIGAGAGIPMTVIYMNSACNYVGNHCDTDRSSLYCEICENSKNCTYTPTRCGQCADCRQAYHNCTDGYKAIAVIGPVAIATAAAAFVLLLFFLCCSRYPRATREELEPFAPQN
jgi:hypothetical protein